MVFQDYALYPHKTVFENMAFGLRLRKRPEHEINARVAEAANILQIDAPAGAQAARAVGRPAAARRDGALDRAPAQGVPVRRAALEPRRAAARRDARRDQEAAPEARQHDHLRHARPGGGDDACRPHRRAAGGQPHPVRHARRDLQPACREVRRRLHRLAADELPAVPRRRRRPHAAPAGGARPARSGGARGRVRTARRARADVRDASGAHRRGRVGGDATRRTCRGR